MNRSRSNCDFLYIYVFSFLSVGSEQRDCPRLYRSFWFLHFCFVFQRLDFGFGSRTHCPVRRVRLLCMSAFRRVCNNNLLVATQRIIVSGTIIMRVGVYTCQPNCVWISRKNLCATNNNARRCIARAYGVLRLSHSSQTIVDIFDLNQIFGRCPIYARVFDVRVGCVYGSGYFPRKHR